MSQVRSYLYVVWDMGQSHFFMENDYFICLAYPQYYIPNYLIIMALKVLFVCLIGTKEGGKKRAVRGEDGRMNRERGRIKNRNIQLADTLFKRQQQLRLDEVKVGSQGCIQIYHESGREECT